jgi:hypothetical protein
VASVIELAHVLPHANLCPLAKGNPMKSRKQKGRAVPPSDTATPFFARFLEDQHDGDAEARAVAPTRSLKYPSDRDEEDVYSPVLAEATAAKAGPSRMTLKYPSDRDEIDLYSTLHGNAADAP